MEEISTGWEIFRNRFLRTHQDKTAIYRIAVDIIASILANLDRANELSEVQTQAVVHEFNRDRIRLYGYMAMLAPQYVMDRQDALIDYLVAVTPGTEIYDWLRVRDLALNWLNAVRQDVGLDTTQIVYSGNL